ncbi:hypothetical protein SLEP1_g12605 [Rubroshorea leprosula]|uniref:Uncharacterized protein n=1 Tax=Rubroshorea leprosula TaxID=152421 RepID=A0AAV5IM87_9ROSI|nr:hypothetical protein SLEP1_g12605 [Rubroshorea leprosula]
MIVMKAHGVIQIISKGFGAILIPGDDKVLSKPKEAKRVEALVVNMEEALVNLEVRRKILASKIGEPPLLDNILSVVDSIIDWSDPISFTTKSVKKAKASEAPPQKPTTAKEAKGCVKPRLISELPPLRAGDFELVLRGFILKRKLMLPPMRRGKAKVVVGVSKEKGKKVTKVINFDSNKSSNDKSSVDDASFESENGSKQRGKYIGFQDSIDINRAAPEEFESDVCDATKKSISNKSIMDAGAPIMGLAKKVVGPNEVEHSGQSSSAPTKSGEIDDSAMRLLKNLDEMNEDKDISLARFNSMPMGGSKAKKVVVEDTFSILYATMRYMEVTPFAKMNEDFFYLCRDAIDDAKSINFKVNIIRTHLSNVAKAYLEKTEFGTTRGDMAESLDGQIKE